MTKIYSEDILDQWKKQRVVVVDSELSNLSGYLVLLTDYVYWADNIEILVEWCRINGGDIKGSTVLFDDSQQLSAFMLRWA